MKIGILTFHSQLNYGGVLQAFSLQKLLLHLGHDVEIIDYWMSPNNQALLGDFFNRDVPVWKRLIKFIYASLRQGYVFRENIRRARTISFIKKNMRLSAKTYKTADELNKIQRYDCIVVGSDQVWDYRWYGKPNPYLLGDIDHSIRRVSYAASFGFKALPDVYLNDYRNALLRHHAISVREREGVSLVFQWIGQTPKLCLDPTLFQSAAAWSELSGVGSRKTSNYIVCYWLGDLTRCLPLLKKIAKERQQKVLLFVGTSIQGVHGQPIFRNIFSRIRILCSSQIVLSRGAGPIQFLRGIANADVVFTDSYHGLLFSCIYKKPVKVCIDTGPERLGMSSRIYDFCNDYGISEVIEGSLETCSLNFKCPDYSAVHNRLKSGIEESIKYLKDALK